MSTIDDQQRLVQEVDETGLTVHGAHSAVRARLRHCRHCRARAIHCRRRTRRPQMSQYRAAVSGTIAESPTIKQETGT
jgi:hypothetical protein